MLDKKGGGGYENTATVSTGQADNGGKISYQFSIILKDRLVKVFLINMQLQ
ncbi:protein of unknown function (plasmid) [Enterobacter cancerogenus]|nr:protein of unknown function [Enterobacter cancerogenus]